LEQPVQAETVAVLKQGEHRQLIVPASSSCLVGLAEEVGLLNRKINSLRRLGDSQSPFPSSFW
jgi:hypothetical protein